MNERIRELAEQAGVYKLDIGDETAYWVLEKFAELIVLECGDFVATALMKKIGQISASVIATDLVEHFGVEE
jgi:hypothetical protein